MNRMRLHVEYELDCNDMLCVWVYNMDTNERISVGNQYSDEKCVDTVMRVFNEAICELGCLKEYPTLEEESIFIDSCVGNAYIYGEEE